MNLHHAGNKPDWELVDPENRNYFQRVAAATDGYITPANIVSTVGTVGVIDGLRDIHFGRNVKGLAKIATFAPLDVVDGKLAKKSGTASNKGAFYDAACDKAKVAGVLAVTIEKKYLPKSIASLILGQQAINSVITLAAMKDGTELKPTLAGKLNMAAIWATAGAFTFRHLLEKHATKTSDVFEAIGYSAATVVATLGAYATVGYIEQYEKGHLTHSQN